MFLNQLIVYKQLLIVNVNRVDVFAVKYSFVPSCEDSQVKVGRKIEISLTDPRL